MIRCPSCNHLYSIESLECPRCRFRHEMDGEFVSWSAGERIDGIGFKTEYFETLARLETNHFWFRSRNKLIVRMLKRYAPECASLLEIGCGTGYVLSGIASAFPVCTLYGSELFPEGMQYAQQRLPQAIFFQMNACNIPFEDEFDVIGAFDVLEHIKDDQKVLLGMWRALKPGGLIAITVPQHSWLWSSVDCYACHVRRYDIKNLLELICASGFSLVRSTSFISLLLPLMLIERRKAIGRHDYDPLNQFNISTITNLILEGVLHAERLLIDLGIDFPVGGSRLVIARK